MLYKVLKYAVVDIEIKQVIHYYKSISTTLGIRAKQEILTALHDLKTNAHHYLILEDHKHRRRQIRGFPYMLVYTIEGSKVIVKMLFPQKSDPAKLLERLKD